MLNYYFTAHENNYDFDSPQAIDMDLFTDVLNDIKRCRAVQLPVSHSFRNSSKLHFYNPINRIIHSLLIRVYLKLHTFMELEL